MSDQQRPPLRPGDTVLFIHDRGHVETVESCRWIALPTPRWRVVTTWEGNRRIADAAEYIIVDAAPRGPGRVVCAVMALALGMAVGGWAPAHAACGSVTDWPFDCSIHPELAPGPKDTFVWPWVLFCPASVYGPINRALKNIPPDEENIPATKELLWNAGARFGCRIFGKPTKIKIIERDPAAGIVKFELYPLIYAVDIGAVCPKDNDLLEICSYLLESNQ